MARWTRLELATPCVTGRYSNQLNYHRFKIVENISILTLDMNFQCSCISPKLIRYSDIILANDEGFECYLTATSLSFFFFFP